MVGPMVRTITSGTVEAAMIRRHRGMLDTVPAAGTCRPTVASKMEIKPAVKNVSNNIATAASFCIYAIYIATTKMKTDTTRYSMPLIRAGKVYGTTEDPGRNMRNKCAIQERTFINQMDDTAP